MIYHITTPDIWASAQAAGYCTAPSLQTEGFIHCSEQHQVAGVLDRYYKGHRPLILLHIDPDKLRAPLRYELAPSVNELFPHVFGTIDLDAIVHTEVITAG